MELIDWLEWNGVRCTDFGMHVLAQPSIIRPSERYETQTVPGRAGALTLLEGEDVYDNITLSCTCVIDEPYEMVDGEKVSRIAKICGWLTGFGSVKFANRQEGYYRAHVANQISFDKIVRGNPHMSFQVQFDCEPFLYLDSGLDVVTLEPDPGTTTGAILLDNKGNVSSQPSLKVYGAGEGTIMSGQSTMEVLDFSGIDYIILDCEAKVAYSGERSNPNDPYKLLGTRVTGEWLKIPAGMHPFSIEGGITKVEITPRWRCI